ncbi:MATE family efflux transporter [Aliikangiella coralliicola]|uniref:Multidrug-efflux transporter n=1 Tax=Aliikangiella coralliicola TaxID=2592383 RepID=A0A545U4N0_9GAMM|nr:MATE family efflux transporter [Aliikangiella coralliicola]TQV84363.1 MATE family efflux transporter [Aliikangiella coralliicola]
MTDPQPKFVTGSIVRHIITMSLSSSAAILGVFFVDLLDMFFLSLLGESELAAAIGYAGTITFFTTSICIGLSIATGVVTAKAIGMTQYQEAKDKFISSASITFVISVIIVALIVPNIKLLLNSLGATGKTLEFAQNYLLIVVPALPFLGLAMCFSATLRSLGAAKAAMFSTLGGSVVNGVLDPILIFSLDMGVEGAAVASALARVSMFLISGYVLFKHHSFFTRICYAKISANGKEIFAIASPALLTNLATPVGNAYIIYVTASFGDSAVAGFSIIGRVIPVAFSVVFGLSGAVGPIIGQNYGAKEYQRIKRTISFAYIFVASYVLFIWLGLIVLSDYLVAVFNATGDAKKLLLLFCHYVSLSFLFTGITFVSNAVFNNLGKPFYSTLTNWMKATVGTIPFVYIFSVLYGVEGILIGQAIGNFVFGVVAIIFVHYFITKRCESGGNERVEIKP